MKVVLQHHQGFGNVVRMFPLAAHLAKTKGTEVFIECPEQYRSILNLIDYAKWKDPREPIIQETKEKIIPSKLQTDVDNFEAMKLDPNVSSQDIIKEAGRLRQALNDCPVKSVRLYDQVYELHIFPKRIHLYRTQEPPQRMIDFITGQFSDDFRKMDRQIILSKMPALGNVLQKYGLPEHFSLACPCGSQQQHPVGFEVFESWMNGIARKDLPIYYLAPRGFHPNRRHITVDDLAELAPLIAHATEFFTINAAPAAIASARFDKKPLRELWHHVSPRVPRERFQDDIFAKEQVRWEVVDTGSGERIVRQKDVR